MLDRPMFFELILRRFFGQKAYHTASSEISDRSRNEWLRKLAKRILCEVDTVDTHDEHKKQLYFFADQFRKALGTKSPDFKDLTYALLGLVSTLLGYYSVRGAKLASPSYSRTADQYYTGLMLKGGDALQDYYDKNNVVMIRQQIVKNLKANGIDDFHIAMALNTSENAIKRLKNDL